MKQAMTAMIGGIKCDNRECDFMDDSVKVEDYNNWLNRPCPKCGENLLTEEDYNNVQLLMSMVNTINGLYPEGIPENEEEIAMSIDMNGTGEMNFNIRSK